MVWEAKAACAVRHSHGIALHDRLKDEGLASIQPFRLVDPGAVVHGQ